MKQRFSITGIPDHRALLLTLMLGPLTLAGCSEAEVEEYTFRKVMEYELKSDCDDDAACIEAVEAQIKDCMASSDWRRYLENEDNEAELERFIYRFFPCFKDASGNPYFPLHG